MPEMNHIKLKKWMCKITDDWDIVVIHPGIKDKFAFAMQTRGNHDQKITIFIGHDNNLYIKAGGDWDYEWFIDSHNPNAYKQLRFLIGGK